MQVLSFSIKPLEALHSRSTSLIVACRYLYLKGFISLISVDVSRNMVQASIQKPDC